MVRDGAGWSLENFTECLEIWEKNEPSSAVHNDLRLIVIDWIMGRHSDPYKGVRREPGFDNLWFSSIPNTQHDGQVVCCAYWIFEATHTVKCDSIGTLSMPV